MSKTLAQLLARNRPINPAQLHSLLQSPGLPRIQPLDASWFLNPAAQGGGKTGFERYCMERIPGAKFFDVDGIKDTTSPYPHMLPAKADFDRAMGQLGISRNDVLVVYDYVGNFSAPRALWMLRAFHHDNSLLLDNFGLYKSQGYELDSTVVTENQVGEPTEYSSPGLDETSVVSYEQVREIVCNQALIDRINLVDARPGPRFDATAPEPRPEIPSGHAPGAVSIPFSEVLDPVTKTFKSPEELRGVFAARGIDSSNTKDTIFMCGTGVTACVVAQAAAVAGLGNKVAVYDGSWTEYAQRADASMIVGGDR